MLEINTFTKMIESDTTNNLKHNQASNAQKTSFKLNKEKKFSVFSKQKTII